MNIIPGVMEDYSITKETPGPAIASLVCGILAFFIPFFGFVLAILAIIFGVRARGIVRESGGRLRGEGMALAGIICGIGAIGMSLFWIFFILSFFKFLFSVPFMYHYWYY